MYQQKVTSGRRKAFTLIEIMVAAVITIIMIGLVIQITSEVLKLWNRSVGKLSANAEARIAMELLTSDLETAMLGEKDQQWFRVETITKDPDDAESPFDTSAQGQTVGLKLFSPALDRDAGAGNVCAVSYRLDFAPAYQGAQQENYTFVLFRDLENPRATFDSLLGAPELTGGFWDQTVNPENYLAGNIVDFKIYIYGLDVNGDEVVLNDGNDDGEIDNNYVYGGTSSNDEVPHYAEIFITAVSDEGLDILRLPTLSGTGFASEEEVILQHGEVFKRRVNFHANPL